MAQDLSGDLSGRPTNRLCDGSWCFSTMPAMDDPPRPRRRCARDKRNRQIPAGTARREGFGVIAPFLVAVTEDEDGTIRPTAYAKRSALPASPSRPSRPSGALFS